jgi:N-acetylglucosaminyl-diphospho-decaprenol L-rhamnosyltransferase
MGDHVAPSVVAAGPQVTRPDMSILLVCWNNKDYLEPCLRSLYDADLSCSFDVLVVDNGSKDGSQDMLHEKFPEVKIIQNNFNAGLSHATNQGIEATNGRYVLLLNNDTIVNRHALDSMVQFLEKTPDAGAVGGQLLNPDGSYQAGGSNFPSLHEEFLITTRLGALFVPSYPDIKPAKDIRQVDWIGSACLLVRREVFDKIGVLDETYFIYGDEADLQFRIKKAGWKVYYLPDVTTIHYGGRSMDRWKRRKMVYRGKMLFFKKNYDLLRYGLLKVMVAGLTLAKLLFWLLANLLGRDRERAQRELKSNVEVLKLCWKLT